MDDYAQPRLAGVLVNLGMGFGVIAAVAGGVAIFLNQPDQVLFVRLFVTAFATALLVMFGAITGAFLGFVAYALWRIPFKLWSLLKAVGRGIRKTMARLIAPTIRREVDKALREERRQSP